MMSEHVCLCGEMTSLIFMPLPLRNCSYMGALDRRGRGQGWLQLLLWGAARPPWGVAAKLPLQACPLHIQPGRK